MKHIRKCLLRFVIMVLCACSSLSVYAADNVLEGMGVTRSEGDTFETQTVLQFYDNERDYVVPVTIEVSERSQELDPTYEDMVRFTATLRAVFDLSATDISDLSDGYYYFPVVVCDMYSGQQITDTVNWHTVTFQESGAERRESIRSVINEKRISTQYDTDANIITMEFQYVSSFDNDYEGLAFVVYSLDTLDEAEAFGDSKKAGELPSMNLESAQYTQYTGGMKLKQPGFLTRIYKYHGFLALLFSVLMFMGAGVLVSLLIEIKNKALARKESAESRRREAEEAAAKAAAKATEERLWKEASESKDPEVMYNLACMFECGKDVPENGGQRITGIKKQQNWDRPMHSISMACG